MSHFHALARRVCLSLATLLALGLPGMRAWADPPGRAGRISVLDGSATLQQGDAAPVPAGLNWPVTGGERILTAPGSRLELRVGSTALRLDSDTALDVDALDEQHLALRLEHGRLALRVRDGDAARALALATPQGRVSVSGAGRWRVEAGLATDTTSIAALDASATFLGNDDSGTRATVPAGHLLRSIGQRRLVLQDTPLDASDFDRWVAARDAHDDPGPAGQYVSPEMTGAEDLDRFGSWTTTAAWGAVWFPATVAIDWAPYRVGRWAWVAPWGWTWVDAAPWGFAPFHYGRWALVEGRWGWVPGSYVARPVYAPALVGWVGGGGWSVSVSTGPSVGWFPLAPQEPYVPGFDASVAYVRRLNTGAVRDLTRISVNMDLHSVHYVNREIVRAVTVVPASAMAEGQRIERAAVPLHDSRALASVPVVARAPLPAPPHAAATARTGRPEPPTVHAAAQPPRPMPPALGHPATGRELAAPPALRSGTEPPHEETAGPAHAAAVQPPRAGPPAPEFERPPTGRETNVPPAPRLRIEPPHEQIARERQPDEDSHAEVRTPRAEQREREREPEREHGER